MAEQGTSALPLKWELRIGRLALGPDDILVVSVPAGVVLEDSLSRLYREFRQVAQDNRVLVITDDIVLSVLTKADIDARERALAEEESHGG